MMKKFFAFFLVLASLQSFAQGSVSQPNILFISIDDLKPTLGAYGDSYAHTPNLDAIATNGTIFNNAQAQWPVCGPSRASILTGKRPDYTGVWDLQTLIRSVNPNIVTLPQFFKYNGYTVAGAGKTFDTRSVDSNSDTDSWSIPYMKPQDLTFNASYGNPQWNYYQTKAIRDQAQAYILSEGSENAAQDIYKPAYEIGDDGFGGSIPDDAYNDGAATEWLLTEIDALVADGTKPFFLAAGFKNPHLPFCSPKQYYDLYNKNNAPLAAFTGTALNMPSLAYKGSNELESYPDPTISVTRNLDNTYTIPEADQKTLIHAYYAAVSFVDAQVGKLLTKLQEKGIADKTIIVVWGDHGFHLGDHGRWAKHTMLENAARVPFFIYDPRNPAGNTINAPVDLLDIFPTLCDMADLTPPQDMDGESLVPLMNESVTSVKDYSVIQFRSESKFGYSFKNERYRYTVWLNDGMLATDGPTTSDYFAQELYDYQLDPNEMVNYFTDPSYAAVATQMAADAQAYFDNGAGINSAAPAEIVNGLHELPIVVNNDFELVSFDNAWVFSTSGGAVATFSNAGIDSRTGNNGAKVQVTTAASNANVKLTTTDKYLVDVSGKTITFNFYAKGTGVLRTRLFQKTNGVQSFPQSSSITLTGGYQLYSVDYVIPANTTEIRLEFIMGGVTGDIYIDDITAGYNETYLLDNKQIAETIDATIYQSTNKNQLVVASSKSVTNVVVYDIQGKLVAKSNSATVDVTNAGTGNYIVELTIDNHVKTTKKIQIVK